MTTMEAKFRMILRDRSAVYIPGYAVDTFVGMSSEGYAVCKEGRMQWGLTNCCGASAKGSMGAIVCRNCCEEIDPMLGGDIDVAAG